MRFLPHLTRCNDLQRKKPFFIYIIDARPGICQVISHCPENTQILLRQPQKNGRPELLSRAAAHKASLISH